MKQLTMILFVGTALAMSAAAQTVYSQPVRDVENEARNAVEASCTASWTSAMGEGQCDLMTVPAGKRLAIRHAAISCYIGPNNRLSSAYLTANLGAGNFTRPVPLVSASYPNVRFYEASTPVFYHADAGKVVKFTGYQTGPDSNPANCNIAIAGFLVNAN